MLHPHEPQEEKFENKSYHDKTARPLDSIDWTGFSEQGSSLGRLE